MGRALATLASRLAELADEEPALHACLSSCLRALAIDGRNHDADDRQRRRYIRSALAPLECHLRAQPAASRRLVRWLFCPARTPLDYPVAWRREFSDQPALGIDIDAVTALMDASIGLPPLPNDDAVLREWQARQGYYPHDQIISHPSPYSVIRALARQVAPQPGEYLCDLGAGHGRVVLTMALLGIPARGVELLPDRHAAAERARRALRIEEARFDHGSVLDERFWSGAAAITGAGWYYCYDPFDAATHRALLGRLRALARLRPVRLVAFIQTTRYLQRYQQALTEDALRLAGTPAKHLRPGLHVFEVVR